MKVPVVDWRSMVALVACMLVPAAIGSAQSVLPSSLKRIGILNSFAGCPVSENSPSRRRLAELGWVEGKNFVYDCVTVAGGRMDQAELLAAELVARRPDVIATTPIPFVNALRRVTATIPIVMSGTPDPINAGVVTSLARPEANVTGVAWFGFDIMPKRVQILKEVLPEMQRLAIIYTAHSDPKVFELLDSNAAIAAKQLGISYEIFRPAVPEDFDQIFSHLPDQHFDAVYAQPSALYQQNFKRIADLALRYRMPTIGDDPASAQGGLLIAYGGDFFPVVLIRYAEYIDKILRGAKPSELPVEQATKLRLAINLKTAKALGLTIPPALLSRADEVIE